MLIIVLHVMMRVWAFLLDAFVGPFWAIAIMRAHAVKGVST